MRVPGIVFASRELLPDLEADRSMEQVANVATLPGIVEASYAMPDVHWGYGFPIGGVAATDVEAGGVVSPGGVGFDISCGVRLMVSGLDADSCRERLPALMDVLDQDVPRGLGRGALWQVSGEAELREILADGAVHAVAAGFGDADDLAACEDGGRLPDADPAQVSERARERGLGQVGSLGSGNHFLEVQVVADVLDAGRAEAFGLRRGLLCVMIHSGSRGLGHQVCSDHVRAMAHAMAGYGIRIPDRQLACAPVRSPHGEAYMGAMAAAANYGRANRHLLGEAARRAFRSAFGEGEDARLRLLYDVSHNLAKFETHPVDGEPRLLCVHRKGATRSLPPGHPELAPGLRPHGQPVIVPGSMGTASYVMAGAPGGGAFHSTCHGAGRTMSRHEAKRRVGGRQLQAELAATGVVVRPLSLRDLPEEAPFAYKDVDAVVAVCAAAGLGVAVARLRPLGVVKG